MQSLRNMILVSAVAVAVLMTGCGKDDNTRIEYVDRPNSSTYRQSYGYQQYSQYSYESPNLYGYGAIDCNQNSNFNGYNNGFTFSGGYGRYPDAGYLLRGNPDAPMRYQGQCYRMGDVRNMYERFYRDRGHSSTPWDRYQYSPYAQFELYSPNGQSSSGSVNYSQNYSAEWNNSGDYFGPGNNPFQRRRGNEWYFDVQFNGNSRDARIEAGYGRSRRDSFFDDRYRDDDFWSDW